MTRYDDELTQPLEGALEGSTSEPTSPAIGRDEWVARHGSNRSQRGGALGAAENRLFAIPWWAWLTVIVVGYGLVPVVSGSGYVQRVAFDTAVYMLLALGLNVVVGWGGLLDLGYVAFYGVGAYTYAMVSSGQFGLHLPTYVAIPFVVLVGAIVGFLVGLPSRRLTGDYLAIVTLFFLQLFLTIAINGDQIGGHDITGGANGILDLDPFSLFGHQLDTTRAGGVFNFVYLYVLLAFFVVVYVALRFVNLSRTGRAWRSLREDALAAEVMGMPVNSLKLLAFSFGAAVAALSGTFPAAVNGSVFPLTYSFPLLITIYAMVILGGSGSQGGVVLGAIIIGVLLELLRDPGNSRYVFYCVILLGLLAALKLTWRLAAVLGGIAVLGFALHAIARAVDPAWVSGPVESGNWLTSLLDHWVVIPSAPAGWIAPVSYMTLVLAALVLTMVRGWARLALLVPTVYLAAFVWENVMITKPEPTRYIILGVLLISLMILRPSGLLGERRVEIV